MSNRNWPIAILAIGVPLGVAAWLLTRPYAGLPVPEPAVPADVVAVPAAAAPAAPVAAAPVAAVPAPAAVPAAPMVAAAPAVGAAAAALAPVTDAQRVVIAYTGNIIGETDPCG